jgi:tRNA pseudouridine55 synthase
MILGKTSNTFDSEGEIKDGSDHHNWNAEKLQKLINQKFLGEISQIPPKFSALKIQGQRAYELARKGVDFEIKARQALIHELEIKSFSGAEVVFFVRCGSGTYIRSLANDIGEAMGCGAYLKALRRSSVGSFKVEDALDLQIQIESSEKGPRVSSKISSSEIEKNLKKWELFSKIFPRLAFDSEEKKRLLQGQRIPKKENLQGEFLAHNQEDFFGIIEAGNGIIKLKKQVRL